MPSQHLHLPDHTNRIAQLAECPAPRPADDRSSRCESAPKVCSQAGGPTALVGHDVTFVDAAGSHSGLVEEVALTPEGPRLTVAGTCGVDPARLTAVH